MSTIVDLKIKPILSSGVLWYELSYKNSRPGEKPIVLDYFETRGQAKKEMADVMKNGLPTTTMSVSFPTGEG